MSNDINEELSRLEEALKEADPELAKQLEALEAEQEDSAVQTEVDTEGVIYNTDKTDTDLEAFSESVRNEKRKKRLIGLLIYNAAVIAGIVCVLIFWLIRYRALFL